MVFPAGTIDFNEFLQMMTSKMVRPYIYCYLLTIAEENYVYTIIVVYADIQSEKDSKEEILKAFKLFDDDDTVRNGAL